MKKNLFAVLFAVAFPLITFAQFAKTSNVEK